MLVKTVKFHMAAAICMFFIDSYVVLLPFLVPYLRTFILFHILSLYSQFY